MFVVKYALKIFEKNLQLMLDISLFILIDKYSSIFLFIEYNYMRVKISFDPHI